MKIPSSRFALLGTLLLQVTAWAQSSTVEATGLSVDELNNMELKDLLEVVVATGRPQRAKETPSIVSLIDFREIRLAGYRTVGEALRRVPGLAFVDDHVDLNVGVRGTFASVGAASDILKVMINGYPVQFRPNSGNTFGFDLIPIHAVKRIEVIRGPGSALYGANAFLGVINIITFDGADFAAEGAAGRTAELSLEGFSLFNPTATPLGGSAAALFGGKWGPLQLLVSSGGARTDRAGLVAPGRDDLLSPAPVGYPSPGWSRGTRQSLLGNDTTVNDVAVEGSFYGLATLDVGLLGRLSLDLNWQYRDKAGEFLSDSTLTHKSRVATTALYTRLLLESPTVERGFSWRASAGLFRNTPLPGDRIVDDSSPDIYKKREFGSNGFFLTGQGSYSPSKTRTFTLGTDLEVDDENLLTLVNVNEAAGGAQSREDGYGNRTFSNFGMYAQALWSILEGLQVIGGARLDTNNVIVCNREEWNCFGRQSSPISALSSAEGGERSSGGRWQMSNRLALVYAPTGSDFHAKLAYGSSYKPPSPFQLYHARTTLKGTLGNPYLKPQTAHTVEALVGYQFAPALDTFVNVFHSNIRNVVGAFKGDVALEGRNFNSETVGLEAGVDFHWKQRLDLSLNGSYLIWGRTTPLQRADESEAEWHRFPFRQSMPLGQYPNLMLGLYAGWKKPEWHLNIGANVNYIGSRGASLIHKQLFASRDPNKTYTLRPYALLRLNVSSTGLYFFGDQRETIFSLMYFGTPGTREAESGYSGVDIPVTGPAVFLRITQMI